MSDLTLGDIKPPILLSPDEIPALLHCDADFCHANPAEASAVIQGAHALICNLVFERDTYRDGSRPAIIEADLLAWHHSSGPRKCCAA
jgi:hypothetical protein